MLLLSYIINSFTTIIIFIVQQPTHFLTLHYHFAWFSAFFTCWDYKGTWKSKTFYNKQKKFGKENYFFFTCGAKNEKETKNVCKSGLLTWELRFSIFIFGLHNFSMKEINSLLNFGNSIPLLDTFFCSQENKSIKENKMFRLHSNG